MTIKKTIKRPNLRRYHHKVYFPENTGQMCLEFLKQIQDIDITNHAAQQLMEDARGIIPLPTKNEMLNNANSLIEFYEILDENNKPTGKIQKMLLRVHNLSEKYDYSYVLARESFIVSAWANDKNDDHRLTSNNEYYSPKEING